MIDSNDSICGCKEHTDWGYLALLITDSEGLQIKTTEGWVNVLNKPNHFIVNVSDMLEIISNGKYKSTIHRVITTEEKYSIVFFYEPSEDCIIKTLNENFMILKIIFTMKLIVSFRLRLQSCSLRCASMSLLCLRQNCNTNLKTCVYCSINGEVYHK